MAGGLARAALRDAVDAEEGEAAADAEEEHVDARHAGKVIVENAAADDGTEGEHEELERDHLLRAGNSALIMGERGAEAYGRVVVLQAVLEVADLQDARDDHDGEHDVKDPQGEHAERVVLKERRHSRGRHNSVTTKDTNERHVDEESLLAVARRKVRHHARDDKSDAHVDDEARLLEESSELLRRDIASRLGGKPNLSQNNHKQEQSGHNRNIYAQENQHEIGQ